MYTGPDRVGDFGWMIEREEYSKVLFVFNDNEEQFIAFKYLLSKGDAVTRADRVAVDEIAFNEGAGNAVIRPYQRHNKAVGIPTGRKGKGYTNLGEARPAIDMALLRVVGLLLDTTKGYDTVAFSANADGSLGVRTFAPAEAVRLYITCKLYKLKNLP